VEISDGLFRRTVLNYGKNTIRELVANAIFHKPYTLGGDIFINLYPDYLEIHNPGLLPIGVTPENILQESVRRNETLCNLATDLELMETEGSGIDKVYEELLSLGKQTPIIEERPDRVVVTVNSRIIQPLIIRFIELMTEKYGLRRKERIALGLIAQYENISVIEFKKILSLDGKHSVRSWLDRLVEFQIIVADGKTKNRKYSVNPEFVREEQSTFKTKHPTTFQDDIITDLKMYPYSSLIEINERLGKEITAHKLRRTINKLIEDSVVSKTGSKKTAQYFILQKSGK
jgi:ATP-dependent DNA helicase RecG